MFCYLLGMRVLVCLLASLVMVSCERHEAKSSDGGGELSAEELLTAMGGSYFRISIPGNFRYDENDPEHSDGLALYLIKGSDRHLVVGCLKMVEPLSEVAVYSFPQADEQQRYVISSGSAQLAGSASQFKIVGRAHSGPLKEGSPYELGDVLQTVKVEDTAGAVVEYQLVLDKP